MSGHIIMPIHGRKLLLLLILLLLLFIGLTSEFPPPCEFLLGASIINDDEEEEEDSSSVIGTSLFNSCRWCILLTALLRLFNVCAIVLDIRLSSRTS